MLKNPHPKPVKSNLKDTGVRDYFNYAVTNLISKADFLKKLKRVAPEIKVVVFSNHSSDECRLLAKRAGADKFLDKSTDSELLVPLLQLWQQQNFESTYRK